MGQEAAPGAEDRRRPASRPRVCAVIGTGPDRDGRHAGPSTAVIAANSAM